jgi:hypothetical protein
MVGDYLGGLLFESHNFKKSIEAYENEVSRQGKVDPDLTIEFASKLYYHAEGWIGKQSPGARENASPEREKGSST